MEKVHFGRLRRLPVQIAWRARCDGLGINWRRVVVLERGGKRYDFFCMAEPSKFINASARQAVDTAAHASTLP